jgi:hypothetical protein
MTNVAPQCIPSDGSSSQSNNWLFQQQFAGSSFNTSTQMLTAGGTEFAWDVFYQGQFYDDVPGVYLSTHFKNAIGFTVYGVKRQLDSTDIDSMLVNHSVVLYTNVIAAVHYGWRVLVHGEITEQDRLLTKRIVGGEVWIGDKRLREASSKEDNELPRMLVGGMPVVYRQIARAFA